MKVAISSWQGRISPVFDVARQGELIEIDDSQVRQQRPLALPEGPDAKIDALLAADVGHVICGAISRSLEAQLADHGIQLHAFISGDVAEVLTAFLTGHLGEPGFAMPGCRAGRRQRFRGCHGDGQCVCPICGSLAVHRPGQPCRSRCCTTCGSPLTRA